MCSNALCSLSSEDFPTLEVFEMVRVSGYCDDTADVVSAAHHILHQDFWDAAEVLASPSWLKSFLNLPYTPVLALMDDYTSQDNSADDLVELFTRWRSGLVGRECIRQLCALTATFPVTDVFSLQPDIQKLPAMDGVMKAAKRQLVAKYGNTLATVTSPALLHSFLALPRCAVLILLKSKRLVTDSEVTVLLLLDAWLETGYCPPGVITELISAVRYSRLPSTYLTELLETRSAAPTISKLLEVVHFKQTGWHQIRHYSTDWYKRSRGSQPLDGKPEVELRHVVRTEDLFRMLELSGSCSSKLVYAAGFLWGIQFSVVEDRVWYGIVVKGVSSLTDLQEGIVFSNAISCCYKLGIGETNMEIATTQHVFMNSSNGYILPEGTDGGGHPAWWADYIEDGAVTFLAVISDINQ